MIRTFALVVFFFGSLDASFGQAITSPRTRAELLSTDDVVDAYSIADMSFVIRESKIFDSKIKETDLSKLLSPAEAVKRGLPDQETGLLIDRLLHRHHEPYLVFASAVNNGDAGFYWHMKWHLFPSPGGFSGIPYEYHAIVRSDGTYVKPELFLCDDYGTYSSREMDQIVFSVLAIDDLLPTTKSEVDLEKIRKAADRSINLAKSEFKIESDFRSLTPKRIVFPGVLSTKAPGEELEVWLVRFVDKKIENPENVKYVGSIAVWVTSDLLTSELTMGDWAATPKRKVVAKNAK